MVWQHRALVKIRCFLFTSEVSDKALKLAACCAVLEESEL